MKTLWTSSEVNDMINAVADRIALAFDPKEPLLIVGIVTGGRVLADRLAEKLGIRGFADIHVGSLDITFYRDDLQQAGPRPLARPTDIEFDMDDRPVLLVDDVLFTGRSTRSALDALVDFGRPSLVRLAVLVDRGGRELPIQADFVGLSLPQVSPDTRVTVRFKGPDQDDEISLEPRKHAK